MTGQAMPQNGNGAFQGNFGGGQNGQGFSVDDGLQQAPGRSLSLSGGNQVDVQSKSGVLGGRKGVTILFVTSFKPKLGTQLYFPSCLMHCCCWAEWRVLIFCVGPFTNSKVKGLFSYLHLCNFR
jgi:hypothetical protein